MVQRYEKYLTPPNHLTLLTFHLITFKLLLQCSRLRIVIVANSRQQVFANHYIKETLKITAMTLNTKVFVALTPHQESWENICPIANNNVNNLLV